MADEWIRDDLRPLEGSVDPDPAFAAQLFEDLAVDLGFRTVTGQRSSPTTSRRGRRVRGGIRMRQDRRTLGPEILIGLVAAIVVAVILLARDARPAGDLGAQAGAFTPSSIPAVSAQPSEGRLAARAYLEIAGTYAATLDEAAPGASADGLVGSWLMTLNATGAMDVTAPASFQAGITHLSGISFSLAGDVFTTNAFYTIECNSNGRYTWSRVGERLTLTPIDDPCASRRTLLTADWTITP
jgi:hypothetical protein